MERRPAAGQLVPGTDEGPRQAGRWVDSQALRAGDLLIGADGGLRRVERIEQTWVEALPICNLTVRSSHTFAVGLDALLVHNEGWCDILAKHLGEPGKAMRKNLEKIGIKNGGARVHGHHIVIKTVDEAAAKIKNSRDWYVKQSQRILAKSKIPLLATKAEARTAKDLSNLTYALNNYAGIHSTAYAKAVYEKLLTASPGGATAIRKALADMAKEMNKGGQFW